VFKEEQDACRTSFDAIDWESETLAEALKKFQCPHCSSTRLCNDNAEAKTPTDLVLVCSMCGEAADLDDVIEAALKESLWVADHIAAMEGGDTVLDECPECFKETYVNSEGKSLNPDCGFSLKGYECGFDKPLSVDEYRYGVGYYCSYHHRVMSKDD
jgi:hypothetical protein